MHLGTVDHDAHGDDGEARGVEHKEHDHGVAGAVLLVVERLQALHGFQAEGRGGVVEAEHVGADVHENVADDGMPLGDAGEEAAEHGTEHAGHGVDYAALFANLHDAEPKRQHAREAERNLEGRARGVERGVDDGGEDLDVAEENEFDHGHEEGHEEEGYPDVIEYHRVKGGILSVAWPGRLHEQARGGKMARPVLAGKPTGRVRGRRQGLSQTRRLSHAHSWIS